MNKKLIVKLLLTMAPLIASASLAHADALGPQDTPRSLGSMRLGPAVQAPEGFLSFCTRHPADCARSGDTEGAEAARVARSELAHRWMRFAALDAPAEAGSPAALGPPSSIPAIAPAAPASLALVAAVSTDINHRIRPMSDRQRYGVEDYWGTPLEDDAGHAYGDCEDYALEKRRALVAAGIAPEDLSLAMVLTRRREVHVVLVVSTEAGDYVADSLSNRILRWSDVPYRWLARQEPGQPMLWRAVLD